MIDAITYTDDLPGLRTWLADNAAAWPMHIALDENNVFILLNKTPTIENGNHSVSLVRVRDLDFINASPLEILAQCPAGEDAFVLMTPETKAKYDLAYLRPIITVPARTFMGITHPSHTWQAPERFGGFA